MQETNVYLPIEELSEAKDKQQKAQPIKARMAAKMVMFPTFLPGWERALHEILTFPNGLHDDFVDALSKLGQGIAKMNPARRPTEMHDGEIKPVRLTCDWVQRSSKRRERDAKLALVDL
jgi:hypothetical protein